MKKTVSVMLCAAMLVMLAACGSSTKGEVQKPSSVASNAGVSDAADGADNAGTQNSEAQEATISETVLVDELGVKVTAKSLDTGSIFGPELKLLIENDSGKDLTVQCRDASVNGYMVETMMSADVVAGKKANDSLTFMNSDLERCGISTIADMEFSFHIFTSQGWDTFLDTPLIQLRTAAADTYEYTFDDSGEVAYDGNGVKVVVKGLSEDSSIFGPGVIVYLENSSDRAVTVQTRDVSVNGFMVDAIFSSDVTVGKHAVDDITFLSSTLEENGITAIEDIELSFHIFDSDSWNTIADTDVITLHF